jgi:hypothetical protein
MGMLAEEKNIFDYFMAMQQQAFIPLMRLIKDYSVITDENKRRHDYFLHKVVEPNQELVTPIEKVLLRNLLVPPIHPIAIIQCSLKAELRIPHYQKYYGLSPEGIKRNLPN